MLVGETGIMRQTHLLTSFALILLCGACGILWEFRENHELDEWQWTQGDAQIFTYKNEEEQHLDASLLLRHLHGFQYPSIQIECKVVSPDTAFTVSFTVPVRDEQGDYLGEGSVDLWDLSVPFLQSHLFSPGVHEFQISQSTANPLSLIMEVGLELNRASE